MQFNKYFFILSICVFYCLHSFSQEKYETIIEIKLGEKWWGGMVGLGAEMPFKQTTVYNLAAENKNNQNVPLFVSSAGRYIWSDYPFTFQFQNDQLIITSSYDKNIQITEAGKTLKEAYLAACKKYFPPAEILPDTLFFSMPQYNTWIELMYNQNQKDIIAYADNILKHDFPVGVFMVDDNWQKYYGNFEFKPDLFPDPKGMVDYLHEKGFKIMLWVCPFVSPDSPEYRELNKKGYLIKRKGSGQAAIIPWWNGQSACYDLSNPQAVEHLKEQLKTLQREYGIDGFKFDAGDIGHFNNNSLQFFKENTTSVEMCQYWAEIGLDFPYNEYRAGWKMGLQPLVQRLGDKNYSWRAVASLIPEMVGAGLMGHVYTCPDMIGGGQFSSFLNIDADKFNQPLIVRSAQVHALMPMMQFSVAPWRILDERHLAACRDMAWLHTEMGDYILDLAKNAARTGEPMVRHMEYEFPHQGFAACKDQFMLGDKYLVAPVIDNGYSRKVDLPKGRWKDDKGKIHRGGKTIEIDVFLERLPYFEKLK